ncbi:hypothetical protein GCM10009751_26830 [Myceligenerans crystallogenes]|uniref:Ig-like domain-containing protein n=2 Tax=Myceligenerans crystallogenes TaxID=316335 RepID=A0ABP4ZPW2_9MICO
MSKSLTLAAGLMVAAVAFAGPAAAAPAPQPSGPVPTKTVTTTQKVTRDTMVVGEGTGEWCGRTGYQYVQTDPWTDYTCTSRWTGYDTVYTLRVYWYETVTTTQTVPMVWGVTTQSWVSQETSSSACEVKGANLDAQSSTYNGYICQYVSVAPNVWRWNLYLTVSAWT